MAYSQFSAKIPSQCTCTSCPMFKDFHEPNGRGWCQVFDRVAYQHHQLTVDCQLNLPSESEQELIPEKDRLHCQFNEGDKVKIIESDKDHSQWESFVVVGKKYNQGRFKTTKSYLNEPTWYILIATIDRPIPDQYWKAETDICHLDHSGFIDTGDVF